MTYVHKIYKDHNHNVIAALEDAAIDAYNAICRMSELVEEFDLPEGYEDALEDLISEIQSTSFEVESLDWGDDIHESLSAELGEEYWVRLND